MFGYWVVALDSNSRRGVIIRCRETAIGNHAENVKREMAGGVGLGWDINGDADGDQQLWLENVMRWVPRGNKGSESRREKRSIMLDIRRSYKCSCRGRLWSLFYAEHRRRIPILSFSPLWRHI